MEAIQKTISELKETLAMKERLLGEQHDDLLPVLNKIAGLLREIGRYDEALEFKQRAFGLEEKQFERYKHDPQKAVKFAVCLKELGTLLDILGETERALPIFERIVSLNEAAHGEDSPAVARTANDVAWLLKKSGEPDEAEMLYLKAMDIRKEKYGPEHPRFGETMNNYACFLLSQERFKEAETLLRKARVIFNKWRKPSHPDSLNVKGNLGLALKGEGHFEEAKLLVDEAVYKLVNMHKLTVNHPRILKFQQAKKEIDELVANDFQTETASVEPSETEDD